MELLASSSKVSRKRWHEAVATISRSRAFLPAPFSFRHQHSPLLTDIPIDIDHSLILTNLAKEKNLDELANLGGVDGVSTLLRTDQLRGISGHQEDIDSRHEAFGRNTYQKAPFLKRYFHFAWEALKDPANIILLACAALALGFGIKEYGIQEGWYDGGSIFLAVFVVISVSAISNFGKGRQSYILSKVRNDILVEVVRNGRRHQVSIYEIVVGDVVFLKIGDQVPADGLLIDIQHSLQVDESSITGETDHDHVDVNRAENPFLLSGTKVAHSDEEFAKMVVTCVGMNTFWGEMMSTISSDSEEQTPLQARLTELTSSIRKFGLTVAFLVLVVLLVRYFTGNTKDVDGYREFEGKETKAADVVNGVVGIITTVSTIVIVAIPEGLPLVVTLTLGYSIKRMVADQAMVRKLSAFQTIGSTTTICIDKTGTLTLNQMKVTKFWQGKKLMQGMDYTSIARNVLELFHQGVRLNTTASVSTSSVEGNSVEFSGSPTEEAILSWGALELQMDMEAVPKAYEVVYEEVFNSEKKRSGILVKKSADHSFHVHWKGAAEMILAMCSHYYDLEGNVKDLSGNERIEFEQIIQGMAASSLRCIAFAHKRVFSKAHSIQENGLTFMGFVGLKDPCRPGVKEAVEDCRNAGVDVKMITGENVFTAKAIAMECGILHQDDDSDKSVVLGAEFRDYTEDERMTKVDEICVMARSSPSDKLLMVKCLKEKGHVVAATGGGTNDALILKEADIGLSMGIQGMDVVKESSDIVILDNNFASIVTILKWGRCVCSNIHKFIQFQLTANIGALTINFVAAVSGVDVPLTIIQLLWVNLIMDTLGALALALEKPSKELLEKKVAGQSEPLISNAMWRDLLAQALFQVLINLILRFGEMANSTLIYNVFVLCQIFNLFNARKVEKKNVFEGIHKDKLFVGIVGITMVLQVVLVEILYKFADLKRLSLGEWGISIGIAATSWPIALLVKFIPVPERPFLSYLPCTESVAVESVSEMEEIAGETELVPQHTSSDATGDPRYV